MRLSSEQRKLRLLLPLLLLLKTKAKVQKIWSQELQ